MAIIPPGSTIGILGGGQLGRMTAMAARTLGYHVHVLDPDANCAASAVADRVVAAKFDDADAAADLARQLRRRHARDRADRPRRARRGDASRARASEPRDSRHRAGSVAAEALARARTDFPIGDVSRRRDRVEQLANAQRELGALVRESEPRRLRRPQPGARRRRRRSASAPGTTSAHRASVAEQRARSRGGDLRHGRATAERRGSRLSAGAQLSRATDSRLVRHSRANRRRTSRRGPKRSRAASPTAFTLEGILAVEMFLLDDGPAARERARAASAQLVSRDRSRLLDEPVRADRSRGVRSPARRHRACSGPARSTICSAISGSTMTDRRRSSAPSRDPAFDCISTGSRGARPDARWVICRRPATRRTTRWRAFAPPPLRSSHHRT